MDSLLFPLFKNGFLTSEANFFFAILLGFSFGFVLERTGFTRSQNIANTFYFKSLAVPKIMAVTTITTSTWFILFSYLGLIDLNVLYTPTTYIWPYVVGGIMFGIGMIVSGYCPGTAVAALGTGKSDALVFIIGLFAGMFIYILLYDYVVLFASSSNIGVYKLDDLLGGNQYSSYIITVALEISIVLFLTFLKKITNKGNK